MMGAVGTWLGVALSALCLVAVSLTGVLLALACAARAVLNSISSAAEGALVPVVGGGSASDVRAVMPPVQGAQIFPHGVAILVGSVVAAGVVFSWS